jgi:radical SAM-linked protein
MDPPESLDRKNKIVKRELCRLSNVKVSYRNAHMTLLETVIARGDRAIGAVIRNAWKKGARFDGWDDKFYFGRWAEAALEASVDVTSYTGEISRNQELPWSVVDTGVSQEFLLKELGRSRDGMVTPDCRSGACAACGICDAELKPALTRAEGFQPAGNSEGAAAGHTTSPAQKTCRYRIIYSKGAAVRYIGHLDMAAVFHRALVAAGFDLLYSQGFEPRPKVSFGPPLPFGVLGDAEGFDMTVCSPVTGDPLRVNAMLPPDLRVLSVNPLNEAGPSLSASIIAGKYRFTPAVELDPFEVRKTLNDAREAPALQVVVSKNGHTLTKDIRPLIRELRLGERDDIAVEAVLALDPGATCKPSELLSALFPGQGFFDFLVARTACLIRKNGKLVGIHEVEEK